MIHNLLAITLQISFSAVDQVDTSVLPLTGPSFEFRYKAVSTLVSTIANAMPTSFCNYTVLHSGLSYLLGVWLGHFYDLGDQKFFMPNNGLRAFLGPNWKVFHHGTLRNHFQRVRRAFWSWPIGEKNGISREKSGETISAQKVLPMSHWHLQRVPN